MLYIIRNHLESFRKLVISTYFRPENSSFLASLEGWNSTTETEQEIISESLLGALETHMTTEPKTKESKAEPNENNDKTVWILSKMTEIDASNTKSPKSQRLKDRKKRTHAENGNFFKL